MAVSTIRRKKQDVPSGKSDVITFSEGNRAEIMAAAAQAFMINGFAATSIDTVAEVLGCTKGRIYYQYKSKADLFFDVHREAMLMNLFAIANVAKDNASPLARLRKMIHAQVMVVITRLPFQRVSVQGVELHLSGSTTSKQREVLRTLMDLRDQYEKLFVDVIKEGIRIGELRPYDPNFVVKPLLGALNWMTYWYHPNRDETDQTRQQLADNMADVMLGGIIAEQR
ncbi:MAG: TetR family transcriptional regulator [Polaromonas sp.]|nr:TetR family transcriptional regulator [Polaromonas sp.]